MRQSQLVLEKKHRQYLSDGQISAFCREKVDELKSQLEQDSSINYPTNQRRRYDHRHRTSVFLRMDQDRFIKDINLTFSHYIQDQIQQRIDQALALQDVETDPGPLVSPTQRELMNESRQLYNS